MPSSTFSSEYPAGRSPRFAWGYIWGLSAVLFAALAGSLELMARQRGHEPMVSDSLDLWAYYRSRIGSTEREVVLLGDSRMALDFSTETLRARHPDLNVTMLAIPGAPSPVAVLEDLAADEDFRGTVICALTRWSLNEKNRDGQRRHVEHARGFTLLRALEPNINLWLQSRLAILNASFAPPSLSLTLLRSGQLPPPSNRRTFPDRSIATDYSRADRRTLEKRRPSERQLQQAQPVKRNGAFLEAVRHLRPLVDAIERRGGRVVFVRFPTSGSHWEHSNARYPRELYWDRIEPLADAPTIHFQDVPGMSGFECPDTSHLDRRDRPAFTLALLDELERREVLQPPASLRELQKTATRDARGLPVTPVGFSSKR